MTGTDKSFLALLSKAIRNGNIAGIDEIDANIDWEELYILSKVHDVSSLLYNMLKKANIELPESIADKWEKASLFSSYKQVVLSDDILETIRLLYEAGIEVIIVKGLFLRQLYPEPALRSMVDADILIHPADFPETIKVLEKAGFSHGLFNENVTAFTKLPFSNIEVHSNLIFKHEFKHAELFLQPWDNAVVDEGITKYAKILSLEDCFIYTIAHMAKHLSYKGHGVRQLCDLVLLTESYMDKMDWNSIKKRLTSIELKTLTDIIFSICGKYLNMAIPARWLYDNPDVERIADVLIEFLLKSGVFGYRHGKKTDVFELRQTKKNLLIKSNYLSLITYLLQQFCPPYEAMKGTYKYLDKKPFLLPFAWLSRTGKYLKNRAKYDKQIKDIVSSIEDIDDETKLQRALGLDQVFM